MAATVGPAAWVNAPSLSEENVTSRRALVELFRRLKAYTVRSWNGINPDTQQYEPGVDRLEESLAFADVISSEILGGFGRHVVALDIDHPAWLIPSSTEGHHHLYIDVPGGIEHGVYMDLLGVLAKAGVIEEGYADVSQKRGHSDLRLPWVKKGDS